MPFSLNSFDTTRGLRSRAATPDSISTETANDMDVYMYTGPPNYASKKVTEKKTRTSRAASFFGGRRRAETNALELIVPESPASTRTTFTESSAHNDGLGSTISRLRKSSSRGNLSISGMSISSEEKKSRTKALGEALSTGLRSRSATTATSLNPHVHLVRPKTTSPPPISQPFDFTHLSHHDPRSVAAEVNGETRDVGEEWNRALARESQIRPLRNQASLNSLHSRSGSALSMMRNRSGSVQSTSPTPDIDYNQPAFPCPLTPPMTSHCLRIQEEGEDHHTIDEHADGGICHAITTPDDTSCGRKSVGIEKVILSPRLAATGAPAHPEPELGQVQSASVTMEKIVNGLEAEVTCTEAAAMVAPEMITEIACASDLDREDTGEDQVPDFPQNQFLSVRPARPLSQMSAVSDTLNGNFTVPPQQVVRNASVRSRKSVRAGMHKRVASDKSFLDSTLGAEDEIEHPPEPTVVEQSWEEDIDWIYSAEADVDDTWDEPAAGAEGQGGILPRNDSFASLSSALLPIVNSPPAQSIAPALIEPLSPPRPKNPVRKISNASSRPASSSSSAPKKKPARYHNINLPTPITTPPAEKRITGLFEPGLLLPDSPGFCPPSTSSDDLLFKAATTALHARTPSITSSIPLLDYPPPARIYREELTRAAQQLDDHIAALNQIVNRHNHTKSPPSSPPPTSHPLRSVPSILTSSPRTPALTSFSPTSPTTSAISPITPLDTEPLTSTITAQLRVRTNSASTSSSTASATPSMTSIISSTSTITTTTGVPTPCSSAHNSYNAQIHGVCTPYNPAITSAPTFAPVPTSVPTLTPPEEDVKDGDVKKEGLKRPSPAPSARSSYSTHHSRNNTVLGAGLSVEVRSDPMKRGPLALGAPASRILGVVEIAPEGFEGGEGGYGLGVMMQGEGELEGFVGYI